MNVQQFMQVISDNVKLTDDQFQKVFHSAFALKNETDWLSRGHDIITNAQITNSFANTNFGKDPDWREVLNNGVLKAAVGFASGGTLTQIMGELGLTTTKGLSKKGKEYLFEVYSFGNSY